MIWMDKTIMVTIMIIVTIKMEDVCAVIIWDDAGQFCVYTFSMNFKENIQYECGLGLLQTIVTFRWEISSSRNVAMSVEISCSPRSCIFDIHCVNVEYNRKTSTDLSPWSWFSIRNEKNGRSAATANSAVLRKKGSITQIERVEWEEWDWVLRRQSKGRKSWKWAVHQWVRQRRKV